MTYHKSWLGPVFGTAFDDGFGNSFGTSFFSVIAIVSLAYTTCTVPHEIIFVKMRKNQAMYKYVILFKRVGDQRRYP